MVKKRAPASLRSLAINKKQEEEKTAAAPAKKVSAPAKKTQSRVIRDAFTMLPSDQERIDDVIEKAGKAGTRTNKSEVIRAGIQLLYSLNQGDLAKAINSVEKIKTGRPKTK